MSIIFYHNPRCTKSREALELLKTKGEMIEVVEYLDTPPNYAELKGILGKLKLSARDILRTNEPEYEALGLADAKITEDALIKAIISNPKLLQRPIAVKGRKAALGRPPEKVLEIL
jgi:arsenate reductase